MLKPTGCDIGGDRKNYELPNELNCHHTMKERRGWSDLKLEQATSKKDQFDANEY